MKTTWIQGAVSAASTAVPLALPYKHIDRPIPPEIFRRQAMGEQVGRPRLARAEGLQTLSLPAGYDSGWQAAQHRSLCFVAGGSVEVESGDGANQRLLPGDAFFEDDVGSAGHAVRSPAGARLVRLRVGADWAPAGAVPPDAGGAGGPVQAGQPALQRMYKAEDGRSYFRDFDYLFPAPGAGPAPARAVRGFHFVSFPDGFFIDWHPEGCNNFVLVSSGELELETGGDGRTERFGPGGVCLAEDRTGEGHIDRARGLVRMLLVEFEDEHLWPVPSAQAGGRA